ncbi:MAG: hypothetical protein F4X22_08255 [Gemmatimonadales bacterium]|nr:hypothetical protein [Holophagales bacterium]MYC88211.1 hypothetical protein [Candidatus Palauibacter denitrificans]
MKRSGSRSPQRVHLLWSVVAAVVFTSCSADEDFSQGVTRIRDAAQAELGSLIEIPFVACVKDRATTDRLIRSALLSPISAEHLLSSDSGSSWGPMHLSSLTEFSGGYIATDLMGGEVFFLSEDLSQTELVASRGDGPGEVRRPVTAAVHPLGDSLYVLDDRENITVHVFDRDRRHVRQLTINGRAADIAVDDKGNIILGADANISRLAGLPGQSAIVAAAFSPDGERLQVLRTVTADSAFSRRFPMPSRSPVRVAATGTWTAVYYPVGGIVDVFARRQSDEWDFSHTAAVCMPAKLDAGYREQFEAVERGVTNVESWFSLVSDVQLTATGGVRTLTLMPSPDGAIHVERFSAAGTRLASHEFLLDTEDIENHSDHGILGSDWPVRSVVLFNASDGGTIRRLAVAR